MKWAGVLFLGCALAVMSVPALGTEPVLEGLRAYQARDFVRAGNLLRPAAEEGNATAQFVMAILYMDGLGVRADAREAIRMAQRAAEQGHRGGQYLLGRAYAEGRGIPQNYVLAHMWFNLAASQSEDETERQRATQMRDAIAIKMTPAQIEEAQRRAAEWRPKKDERPSR